MLFFWGGGGGGGGGGGVIYKSTYIGKDNVIMKCKMVANLTSTKSCDNDLYYSLCLSKFKSQNEGALKVMLNHAAVV